MALSRKVTLQLGAKLRKQRPLWMSTEDDALLLLWQRMVQAVAASAVATQDLGLFVDAAGYVPTVKEHNAAREAEGDWLHDAAREAAGD